MENRSLCDESSPWRRIFGSLALGNTSSRGETQFGLAHDFTFCPMFLATPQLPLEKRNYRNYRNIHSARFTMVKLSKVGISLPYYSNAEQIVENNKKRDVTNLRSSLECQVSHNPQPPRVASVPAMMSDLEENDKHKPLKKRIRRSESSMFPVEVPLETKRIRNFNPIHHQVKPEEYIKRIIEESGFSYECMDTDRKSFLPIEKQQHSSYPIVALAARSEDFPLLRKLHIEGHNLQCSNRFGESIIHIICRRRRDDILDFLVSEVGVSLRVRDDLGRTPFHDAAWTDQPNFKVVSQILKMEPDLIFVRDNRGNSPLSYIPRQNWGEWNLFLDENRNLLLPKSNDVRIVG